MNKLLLLALTVLLIVLAFSMGVFKKDDSKSLSQYVPESVEQLFNETTEEEESVTQKDAKPEEVPSNAEHLNNAQLEATVNDAKDNDVTDEVSKKIDSTPEIEESMTELSTLIEIPDSLIEELQNDLLLDDAMKTLDEVKSEVIQVESENENLQEKYDALTAEFNGRSKVLKELENQIKNLNN